jgi:hypothetical protein
MRMKRLPIIRHIRWAWLSWRVEQHYKAWRALGMLPVNRDQDEAVLDAIWKGER